MKYLVIGIVLISSISGITKNNFIDLCEFEIESNEWNAFKTNNDTLFNPGFVPNPHIVRHDSHYVDKDDTLKLDLKITDLIVDTLSKTIRLQGLVNGGWFGGYSSEVIIMTATRQENELRYKELVNGISPYMEKKLPEYSTTCIRFVDFDYAYTDYGWKGREYRTMECELNYKDNNEVLFFGLEPCYARLFDLKKIIKKYGYQQ
jgi:hypothetical protein